MATQIQYRRGTNAQNAAFTGALAEITVDTTNGTLRVHDGITAGGSNIATVAYVTAQIGALSANSISSGTSNVRVVSSGGNVTTSVGGTSNVAVFATTGAFITGLISASGTITGTTLTGTSLTVTTGNITGGNLLLSGAIIDSAQLDIQTSAANANIALAPNGTGIVTVSTQVSAVGNVTGGNIRTAGLISATGAVTGAAITGTSLTVSTGNVSCGNIVNTNANGVGNIGSTGTRFNQVFALASSAQYADLAEKYTADAEYAPGTVVVFGGDQEVTWSTQSHATQVAGVISTRPAYIMNDTLESTHIATVALTGRVPCLVSGPVIKGDRLVSSSTPGVATRLDMAQYQPGCVIGKAMQNYNNNQPGIIEIAVGRF